MRYHTMLLSCMAAFSLNAAYMPMKQALAQLSSCITNQQCSVAIVRALHPTNRPVFCAQAEKAVAGYARLDPRWNAKKQLKTLQLWFFEATNPIPTTVLSANGSLARQAIELQMPVLEAGKLDVEIQKHQSDPFGNVDGLSDIILLEDEKAPRHNPYKLNAHHDIGPYKGQTLSPF